MAISVTQRGAANTTTNAAQYDLASCVLTAGKFYVGVIHMSAAGTPPTCTSMGGTGLSMTHRTVTGANETQGVRRIELWYGLCTQSGTVTVSAVLDGTSTSTDFALYEIDGVYTTGTNGADAILQCGCAVANGTSMSITLSTFANAANRCFAFKVHAAQEATTHDTGDSYTELLDATHAAPTTGFCVQWNSGSNNNTPGFSWTTSAGAQEIAIELACDVTHYLTLSSATSSSNTSDSVALAQTHTLVESNPVSSSNTASSVALEQTHTLAPAAATGSGTSDGVALGQTHTLTLGNATGTGTAADEALEQTHTLTANNASGSSTADGVALGQTHNLTLSNASGSSTADDVLLPVILAPDNAAGSATASSVALEQTHTLGLSNASNASTADSVALQQIHVLGAADAAGTGSASSVALEQAHNLALAAAVMIGVALGVALEQTHTLAISNAVASGSTADDIEIPNGVALGLLSGEGSGTASSVALEQTHALALSNAVGTIEFSTLEVGQTISLVLNDVVCVVDMEDIELQQTHTLALNSGVSSGSTASGIELNLAIPLSTYRSLGMIDVMQYYDFVQVNFEGAVEIESVGMVEVGSIIVSQPPTPGLEELELLNASAQVFITSIALEQIHALALSNVLGTGTASSVSISFSQQLALSDAASVSAASSVALQQTHILAASNAQSVATAESVALTQTHALHLQDVESEDNTASDIELDSISHVLSLMNARSRDNTASSAAIGQTHAVAAANGTASGSTAQNAPIGQTHMLGVASAIGTSTASSVALQQTHNLVAANASRAGSAQSVALQQTHILAAANATSTGSTATSVALGGSSFTVTAGAPTVLEVAGDNDGQDLLVVGDDLYYTFGSDTLADVDNTAKGVYPANTAFGQLVLNPPANARRIALRAKSTSASVSRRTADVKRYVSERTALEWPSELAPCGLRAQLAQSIASLTNGVTMVCKVKPMNQSSSPNLVMGLFTSASANNPSMQLTVLSNKAWAARYSQTAQNTVTAGGAAAFAQSLNKFTTVAVRFTLVGGFVQANVWVRDPQGTRAHTMTSTLPFAGTFSQWFLGAQPSGAQNAKQIIEAGMLYEGELSNDVLYMMAADEAPSWQNLVPDMAMVRGLYLPTVAQPRRELISNRDFVVDSGDSGNINVITRPIGPEIRGHNRFAPFTAANVYTIPYTQTAGAAVTLAAGDNMFMAVTKHALRADTGTAPNPNTQFQIIPAGVSYFSCAGGGVKISIKNDSGSALDTGDLKLMRLTYLPNEFHALPIPLGVQAMITKTYTYTYSTPSLVRNVGVWKPVGTGPWPVVVFSLGLGGQFDMQAPLAKALAAEGNVVCVLEFRDAGQTAPWTPEKLNHQERTDNLRQFCEEFIVDAIGYVPTDIIFMGHSGGVLTSLSRMGLKHRFQGGPWIINPVPSFQGGLATLRGGCFFAGQGLDGTLDPDMSSWQTIVPDIPLAWISGSLDEGGFQADGDDSEPNPFYWRYQAFENIESGREAYLFIINRGDHGFGTFSGRPSQTDKPANYLHKRLALNFACTFAARCMNVTGAKEWLEGCKWRPDPNVLMFSNVPGYPTLPPIERLSQLVVPAKNFQGISLMTDPNRNIPRILTFDALTSEAVADDLDPETMRYVNKDTNNRRYIVATGLTALATALRGPQWAKHNNAPKFSAIYSALRGGDAFVRVYRAVPTLDGNQNPTSWAESGQSAQTTGNRVGSKASQDASRSLPVAAFAGAGWVSYLDVGNNPQVDRHITIASAFDSYNPELGLHAGVASGRYLVATKAEVGSGGGQIIAVHSDTGVITVLTSDSGMDPASGKGFVLYDPIMWREANGTLVCVSQVNYNREGMALRLHRSSGGAGVPNPMQFVRDIALPVTESGMAAAFPQGFKPFMVDGKSFGVVTLRDTDTDVLPNTTTMGESQIWCLGIDGSFKLRVNVHCRDQLQHECEPFVLGEAPYQYACVLWNVKTSPDNKMEIWLARLIVDSATGNLKLLDNGLSWKRSQRLRLKYAKSVNTASSVALTQTHMLGVSNAVSTGSTASPVELNAVSDFDSRMAGITDAIGHKTNFTDESDVDDFAHSGMVSHQASDYWNPSGQYVMRMDITDDQPDLDNRWCRHLRNNMKPFGCSEDGFDDEFYFGFGVHLPASYRNWIFKAGTPHNPALSKFLAIIGQPHAQSRNPITRLVNFNNGTKLDINALNEFVVDDHRQLAYLRVTRRDGSGAQALTDVISSDNLSNGARVPPHPNPALLADFFDVGLNYVAGYIHFPTNRTTGAGSILRLWMWHPGDVGWQLVYEEFGFTMTNPSKATESTAPWGISAWTAWCIWLTTLLPTAQAETGVRLDTHVDFLESWVSNTLVAAPDGALELPP